MTSHAALAAPASSSLVSEFRRLSCIASSSCSGKTSTTVSSSFRPCPLRNVGFSSSSFSGSRPALDLSTVSETNSTSRFSIVAHKGYKMKTHKASAKRFRVTGSGKIVCRHARRQHLLRKKSVKRKNRLAGLTPLFRGDIDKVVHALPHMKVNRRQLPLAPQIGRFQQDVDEE
eukprot:TRINITY_DN23454_c0_g1_i1.p1 TRINITY_DN23454_c0_g1~~TRINITY_DN23454_c0_g1_i1.p1  ORF type:complete len:173 (+),score=15.33 TRINITY_DN23454_c0_g1_i1:66-584(+)